MHVSLGFMVYNNHPCPQALPQNQVVIDHNLWFTIITLDLGVGWFLTINPMHYVIYILQSDWSLLLLANIQYSLQGTLLVNIQGSLHCKQGSL